MPRLYYHGDLRRLTGCSWEEVDAGNIRAVISHVKDKYGSQAWRLARTCKVVVKGRNWIFAPKAKLGSSDEVHLFPPLAGG